MKQKNTAIIMSMLLGLTMAVGGCANVQLGNAHPTILAASATVSAAQTSTPTGNTATLAAEASVDTNSVAPSPASGNTVIEPEQLVSKDEAEKLAGNKLKDGIKDDQAAVGLKQTFYESAEEGGRFLQISITQKVFMKTANEPNSIYKAIKDNFPDHVAVTGIGDDAFIATPGLHILSGEYYLLVAVGNTKDAKAIEILKTAGKLAVENLKKIIG